MKQHVLTLGPRLATLLAVARARQLSLTEKAEIIERIRALPYFKTPAPTASNFSTKVR